MNKKNRQDKLRAEADPHLNSHKDFERLYNENAEKLFRIAYNLVKRKEIAEGIVQNVFCNLWERRKNLKIKVPVEAYIVKAVKLSSLDYLRTKTKRDNFNKQIYAIKPTLDNGTEDEIRAEEFKAEINHLVSLLPDRCQEVYRLSREKFMTNKEIASGLHISEKTVENHLTKALNFLRINIREI